MWFVKGSSLGLFWSYKGWTFNKNSLFELGGADVVLGLEWLVSLGEVKANFRKLKLAIGKGEL